jgi:hypothetical protein
MWVAHESVLSRAPATAQHIGDFADREVPGDRLSIPGTVGPVLRIVIIETVDTRWIARNEINYYTVS